MGAEVTLAALSVMHIWLKCFWYFVCYRYKTENSETKSSKIHIDYVKDATVDKWSMSSGSGEDE